MKLIDGVENVDEPKQGMVFNSLDELALHYRKYGKQQGFGVVQKNKRKNTSGHTCYITLSCARQGTRKASSSKPVQTTRTGCKACLNARLVDTKWYVTNVSAKHNHDLSPGKARYFRCNKNLDSTAKRKLLINDRAGISMSKSYNSLAVEAGGYEHLEFGEKDCRNFIAKSRHLRLGTGGAGALCDYFKRMQAINNNFYFAIDFDDDCRLRNVFWADARSRVSYEDFGDVVTFDTTYLTNRYEMPFAPFVGVNHHGQPILLGAALISSEDTETFVWLFETWLNCMNKRAPSAIITDQNRAMKNAIRKVFPNTRHRWCLWHILKKLPEKFGSHSQYHAIKGAIRSCVYESQTRDEFDANWQSLLDCYNLKDNAWLCGLYSERTFWVPAYLKDVFWAGMTTTQRSESMNAFFDGYVHSSTTLKEFVDQYDSALRRKVEKENIADFVSFNETVACLSRFPFEKKFQQLYTIAKFKEVQEDIKEVMYCSSSLITREGAMCIYQVTEQVQINDAFTKKVCFTVNYNESSCEVNCSCCLFESRGVLCRHVISILNIVGVTSLPEKYFLNRWRKDLKRNYKQINSSYDSGSRDPSAERYFDLCKDLHALAEIASNSVEHCMTLKKYVHMLTKQFSGSICEHSPPSQALVSGSTTCNLSIDGTAVESNKDGMTVESTMVRSPLVVRMRGKPPSKRMASGVEKAVTKRTRGKKNQTSDTNSK
jgi:hypothetical protein